MWKKPLTWGVSAGGAARRSYFTRARRGSNNAWSGFEPQQAHRPMQQQQQQQSVPTSSVANDPLPPVIGSLVYPSTERPPYTTTTAAPSTSPYPPGATAAPMHGYGSPSQYTGPPPQHPHYAQPRADKSNSLPEQESTSSFFYQLLVGFIIFNIVLDELSGVFFDRVLLPVLHESVVTHNRRRGGSDSP